MSAIVVSATGGVVPGPNWTCFWILVRRRVDNDALVRAVHVGGNHDRAVEPCRGIVNMEAGSCHRAGKFRRDVKIDRARDGIPDVVGDGVHPNDRIGG